MLGRKLSVRKLIVLAVAAGVLACVILVLLLSRTPSLPFLTAWDGTRIDFLGMTIGTNQWNPVTPLHVRQMARFPKISTVVGPRLPRPPGSVPQLIGTRYPSAALWFYTAKPLHTGDLVVQCLNATGAEVGPPYNIIFRSSTHATVVHLSRTPVEKYADIHFVELSQRGRPISDHGAPIGRFEVKLTTDERASATLLTNLLPPDPIIDIRSY